MKSESDRLEYFKGALGNGHEGSKNQACLAPSPLRDIPIESMRRLCGVAQFVALRHSAFWTREW